MKQIFMLFAALASLFLIPHTSSAQEPPQNRFLPLKQTNTVSVQDIIDPLRIQLSDQNIVHLVGIDIPDLTPYESGPIAEQALTELRDTLKGKRVRLYQTKNKDKGFKNRFGHLLAHLETSPENIWVQGFLLEKGLARVRPSQDNIDMAEEMLAAEAKAREGKLGLWQDELYQVLSPELTGDHLNSWGIVEGTIKSSATINNTTYLNFGDDWRSDFTISIPTRIRKQMVKDGINPLNLTHKKVHVRGWLENFNGPFIELMHAKWLQVLPESADEPIVKLDDN